MSLTGDLKTHNLAEILQLLSFGNRSGVLTMIRNEGTGRLVLHKGHVIYASSDNTNRLGYTLVQKGIVSARDIERALLLQWESKPPRALGAILLEMGVVTREVLEEELHRHIAKVFKDLSTWSQGVFHFKQAEMTPATVIEKGLSTTSLLLKAAVTVDEQGSHADRELWP
jgi:hypothetical protein